jgi:hypothetical protein
MKELWNTLLEVLTELEDEEYARVPVEVSVQLDRNRMP